jgi:hypothetical protein
MAAEEAGHAALSFAVHAWAWSRLGRASRGRVMEARDAAVDALRQAQAQEAEPDAALAWAAGLPSAEMGVDLVTSARSALWGGRGSISL